MSRKRKTTEEHRAEIQELGLKVELVGRYLGAKKPIKYKCLIHEEVHEMEPARVLARRPIKCCVKGNGLIQREKAAAVYDEKLKKIGKLERIDPYIDASTPIRHRCLKHKEIHSVRPNCALSSESGLVCCRLAAQKETAAKRLRNAKDNYDQKLAAAESSLIRIGEYIHARTPIIHICVKHAHIDTISPNNALRGYGMFCCGRASQLATAKRRFDEASRTFIERLKLRNPYVELVGEYKGNSTKTNFKCLKHNEIHPAQPSHMLVGTGMHCCRVARAREIGKITGPLNGTKIDSVWRVLCDMQDKSGNCWLYLFESPCPPFNKFGISSEPMVRARRGDYGPQLIKPRFYPNRDDAV